MLGVILGDIAGSPYEFSTLKASPDFELFSPRSCITDDTVLTIAVMEAFLITKDTLKELTALARNTRMLLQEYTIAHPYAGYGARYEAWCDRGEFLQLFAGFYCLV